MLGGRPAPPARPQEGFDVWWVKLGRIVVKQCGQRAHCNIVITIKDGSIQNVRVDQSFLPNALPDV